MNNDKSWLTISNSPQETLKLGELLGNKLTGGEVIELIGDIGCGKTTLVKGMALGMGSKQLVHSPSFTLANQYTAKGLTIHHLDLHRLNEPGLVRDQLTEFLNEPSNVVIIEWAEIVEEVLPNTRLSIYIKPLDINSREFRFKYSGSMEQLIPRIT